jgi:hypothetical protein
MQFINLLGQNDDKIVISYAGNQSLFIDVTSLTVEILIDDLLIITDYSRNLRPES